MDKNNQKQLKDLYETGTSDEEIAKAKLQQKMMERMLMKQGMGAQGLMEALSGPAGMGQTGGNLAGPGTLGGPGMKKGGKVKKMASGGKVSQLAKANGCATKGKSKGRIV